MKTFLLSIALAAAGAIFPLSTWATTSEEGGVSLSTPTPLGGVHFSSATSGLQLYDMNASTAPDTRHMILNFENNAVSPSTSPFLNLNRTEKPESRTPDMTGAPPR